ncbi:hypothetical protein BRD13_05535 [Halobacteriales archaeon SW_5_70_135]|nr:MAG: hypothetical protein BRD13_05535 [Halobacteriales archaeon SW_5_70_135]
MSVSNPVALTPGQFEGTTSVLFLSPDSGDDGVCPRLLLGGDAEDAGIDLLRIAYRDPGRVVEGWPTHVADPPARARLITAGRAAAVVEEADLDVPAVERVSPADLTELGIRTSEVLEEWSDDDRRSVVCLDSITDVLDHVSFETAYRFLHVFTNQLCAADAIGHFHMTPEAHDDCAVQRTMALFDVVAEQSDGDVSVRSRRP